jgi:fructosamine-3-kinase
LAHAGDWLAAGRELARLHGCTQPHFGWPRDNAIGASPQFNAPCPTWAEFYRERRLRPQFAIAAARGLHRIAAIEPLACAASDALLGAHMPKANLLHGDLWRGNLAFDTRGFPVVFDPATYYGDAETDLAMSRLFGGFPQSFYDAYDDERRPLSGAHERLHLYQLYHVLNHANLFGGGYVAQAATVISALEAGR